MELLEILILRYITKNTIKHKMTDEKNSGLAGTLDNVKTDRQFMEDIGAKSIYEAKVLKLLEQIETNTRK